MDPWLITGETLEKLEDSERLRRSERRVQEIGTHFDTLDEHDQVRLRTWVGYLLKDANWVNAEDAAFVEIDEEEEDEEMAEEISHLAKILPTVFKALKGKSYEELTLYAYALLEYHLKHNQTN